MGKDLLHETDGFIIFVNKNKPLRLSCMPAPIFMNVNIMRATIDNN